MPRHPSATAATLEQQAAGDSEIGSMDADGREVLPDFEQVAAPLDREQKLADLDARDDALNGTVRPSERCWNPAPSGIACAYRDGHDGRHSWQFDPEPESTEQPALPDMPEPEQNEYTVPTEASFGKAKLQSTPGLRAIGDRLIESDENLEHLIGVEIRYAWRRRGGTRGGLPKWANIKRPSVWEEFLTGGRVLFLVEVAADHVRDHRFSPRQIDAAIHSQLCRTERDPDDHDAYRILGPDFSGSIRTMDRFGMWEPSLREMQAHVARLPMEQAIEDADDAEDGDEGEGDE